MAGIDEIMNWQDDARVSQTYVPGDEGECVIEVTCGTAGTSDSGPMATVMIHLKYVAAGHTLAIGSVQAKGKMTETKRKVLAAILFAAGERLVEVDEADPAGEGGSTDEK